MNEFLCNGCCQGYCSARANRAKPRITGPGPLPAKPAPRRLLPDQQHCAATAAVGATGRRALLLEQQQAF